MYSHQLDHSAAASGGVPPPQGGGPPYFFHSLEFLSALAPPYFNGLFPPIYNMWPLHRETGQRFNTYNYPNRAATAIPSTMGSGYRRRTHTMHPHQIMDVPAWSRRHPYVQVQERNDLPDLEPARGRNRIQEDETMILDIGTEWRRENHVERDRGLSEKLILKYLKTRNCHVQVNINDREPKICVVCQDDLCQENRMIGVVDCGHEYHESCIRQWLQQKNICPLCKTIALPVM
ncbi:E3 ubiquitin-protein ligase MBR2 [Sesamum alatum]|uniref:RING-type E3 ubiquitin transferase n=1 Tax=Sesamum alatum TaxID=300844 RepID=A0AAE2CQ18_9LAMI|nr:E3 ubiquitin-protein ligase MBR2 [Sesamum alatum]